MFSDVRPHGVQAHAAPVSDLPVAQPSHQAAQHVLLALGQVEPPHLIASDSGRRLLHADQVEQRARHGGRQRRAAGEDALELRKELAGRALLEQVAVDTSRDGVENRRGLFEHGQHHDRHRRVERLQPPSGLDPAHPRQLEIHEHEIPRSAVGFGIREQKLGARHTARQRETGRVRKQQLQALPIAQVVLHQRHADWVVR